MRTLYEILESARDGEKPTHEECYWAMLALDSLGSFDRSALRTIAGKKILQTKQVHKSFKLTIELEHNTSFERIKHALGTDPKSWVGPTNDPANPEYQENRRTFLKLADKVVSERRSKLAKINT